MKNFVCFSYLNDCVFYLCMFLLIALLVCYLCILNKIGYLHKFNDHVNFSSYSI